MNLLKIEQTIKENKPTSPYSIDIENNKVIFYFTDGEVEIHFKGELAKIGSFAMPKATAYSFMSAGRAYSSAGTFIDKYNQDWYSPIS